MRPSAMLLAAGGQQLDEPARSAPILGLMVIIYRQPPLHRHRRHAEHVLDGHDARAS